MWVIQIPSQAMSSNCINIFLSEGAGLDTITREMESNGEFVQLRAKSNADEIKSQVQLIDDWP